MPTQSINQTTFQDLSEAIGNYLAWTLPNEARNASIFIYPQGGGCVSFSFWGMFRHKRTTTTKPSKAKLVRTLRGYIEARFPEPILHAHLFVTHNRKLFSRRIHIIKETVANV